MLSWTRLLLSVLCLVIALPGVFTFQSIPLWKATLAVTEYGHRLALLPAIVGLWNLTDPRVRGRFGFMACAASATVLLLPVVLASFEAQKLPAALEARFPGSTEDAGEPLSWGDLLMGSDPAVVEAQELRVPRERGDLRLLFFPTSSPEPAPCLVILHSGGWEHGRPDEFPAWNHYWAGQGYAVVSVGYRLAPEWKWPAQRDDVRDTLAWLKGHAGKLGIDPERFVLIGRSAGGQIATAAAHSLRDPAVVGCVSLYAPGDMVFAWQFADPNDVLDSPRLLSQYLGGTAEEQPELYRSASATLIAEVGGPPTLMVHGQRDALVWCLQSARLASRLRQVDVPHHFVNFPWATHALDYPFHGPGAQLTRFAVDRFLRSTMSN